MDWFKALMTGLQLAPGIISHLRGTAASNATKQQKALDYVETGIATFGAVDPAHAQQVLGHPAVRQAIRTANDWIYFAGKVADAVANGQEPPSLPAPIPPPPAPGPGDVPPAAHGTIVPPGEPAVPVIPANPTGPGTPGSDQ